MISLLMCLVLGCASDPHATLLPADVSTWETDPALKESMPKISETERRVLKEYAVRKLLTGGLPKNGISIGDAIKEQTDIDEKQALQEAEEAALAEKVKAEEAAKQQALLDAVTVSVTSLLYVPANYKYNVIQDFLAISVAFANKTDKDITGVKGSITFSDMFGDPIKSTNLSYDEGVPAHSTNVWSATLDYNQFVDEDVKLGATPLAKMKVAWHPEVILYADGSSLTTK